MVHILLKGDQQDVYPMIGKNEKKFVSSMGETLTEPYCAALFAEPVGRISGCSGRINQEMTATWARWAV